MSICLSIVSHGQNHLANDLLVDLAHIPQARDVVLTQNKPDPTPLNMAGLTPPPRLLNNRQPMGFGANHNQAFGHCRSEFFLVCNPDIRMPTNPLPAMLKAMEDPNVAVVSPLVVNPDGQAEDSARRFPQLGDLLQKALGRADGRHPIVAHHGVNAVPVDWNAGMFLLFRASAFKAMGGFDERYHLYYEDVDICARLWNAGWTVAVTPNATVVHAAQRTSRRNLRYMAWHAASMARYLWRHSGRLPPNAPSQR
jgi:GT2 family glycosyltransferase